VDWNIGRLLTELKQLGVDNKTIIAFHADHGWSLGEAGEVRVPVD
jgi:arylsulfatase A-like enzyme